MDTLLSRRNLAIDSISDFLNLVDRRSWGHSQVTERLPLFESPISDISHENESGQRGALA